MASMVKRNLVDLSFVLLFLVVSQWFPTFRHALNKYISLPLACNQKQSCGCLGDLQIKYVFANEQEIFQERGLIWLQEICSTLCNGKVAHSPYIFGKLQIKYAQTW